MGAWWNGDVEYARLEAWLLVVYIIIALTFDLISHLLRHFAEHSFAFGVVDVGSNHDVRQKKPLMGEHLNRAYSEFMILGFLTLCVFTFAEFGGTDLLVARYPPPNDGHLPDDKSGWRHTMEYVHINLFLAMACFFFQSFSVALRGKNMLRSWQDAEQLRLGVELRRGENVAGADSSGLESSRQEGYNTTESIEFYTGLRAYFISQALAWRSSNPLRWNLILERLHLENEWQATGKVQAELERPFVFCKYAGYCIEDSLFDFIEVAPVTWLFLLMAVGVFYLFSIFVARTRLYDCMFMFGGLAIVTMVAIMIMMRKQNNRISTSSSDRAPPLDLRKAITVDKKKGKVRRLMHQIHVHFNTEYLFARTLQVILIFLNYIWIRWLGDLLYGHHEPSDTGYVFKGCILTAFLVSLEFVVPHRVPHFLLLMCLPPYVTEEKLDLLLDLLGPKELADSEGDTETDFDSEEDAVYSPIRGVP